MSFDLQEIKFDRGRRFRVSDGAAVASYNLINNYRRRWEGKPRRDQILRVIRSEYETLLANHNPTIKANAFWFEPYFNGEWYVEYGFGTADFNDYTMRH